MIEPDYIFETSWEVCNRVGGIYAVLSTRAASMQKEHPDKVVFFGPDFGTHSDNHFVENKKNSVPKWLADWARQFGTEHAEIPVRIGRWDVPGEPLAVLLRADALWQKKNEIYAWAWENFGVQSHAAYGDYDESCLFGYAAGMCMVSLYDHIAHHTTPKSQTEAPRIAMHSNEWQTAFSIFYVRHYCPQMATLFTTHATGIGRSIAGNGKPLYDCFEGFHGDQMAEELNMVSKHSVEKEAAHWVDCFTTVSDITARECAQLLDKAVDIVTPNGFEPDFVPTGKRFAAKRAAARKALHSVAEQQFGRNIGEDCLMVCIAGRQEWKNKGIDVFLQSMQRLGEKMHQVLPNSREVVAFVVIPYLNKPIMRFGRVNVVFIPYYLDGHDPMFSEMDNADGGKGFSYYDLLIGMDATVFPSYYEPWGYTPLESVAFHIPTVTTSLAGFGAWAKQVIDQQTGAGSGVVRENKAEKVVREKTATKGAEEYKISTLTLGNKTEGAVREKKAEGLMRGVEVIDRTDSNYGEVVERIADSLIQFLQYTPAEVEQARKAAAAIAHKAEWRFFFKYYRKAYDIAFRKAKARNK